MNGDSFDTGDRVIRITREEANSPHVDELLQRQMSLRGETGPGRTRRRRWYYANWFIFMIAGGVAALLATLALEPVFDDLHYWQGRIEWIQAVRDVEGLPPDADWNICTVTIAGETILVADQHTRLLPRDGKATPLRTSELESGREIGVYVEEIAVDDGSVYFANFVVPDPAPLAADTTQLSLRQQALRTKAAGLLIFSIVAAAVGLAVGAADGLVCRLVRRALLAGGVGLLAGFIGGFFTGIIAELAYMPLNAVAVVQEGDAIGGLSAFGFFVQMSGRALAWCLAGMGMGLGQGLALRSKRLLLYGFVGGTVGGLIGGLLFDPIDLLLLGTDKPSAHVSRFIGFTVTGAIVGAMIGVVERLARDAWLRMVEGPLAGKEFLLFRDTMWLGASPRSQIYLFNDPDVASEHAVLRTVGDHYEIENACADRPVQVNGRPVDRCRLRHGDEITIGRTVFAFQKRRG